MTQALDKVSPVAFVEKYGLADPRRDYINDSIARPET